MPPIPTFPEVKVRLKVPGPFDADWVKSMKDIKLRPDDIWIVTYPKCGTTWAQQIVRLIINRGKEDGLKLDEAVPWVECFTSIPALGIKYHIDIDKMASSRAFKSHFPYDLMPCGSLSDVPGKYIYVLRNPRDVAVSFFHHYRALPFLIILYTSGVITWTSSVVVMLTLETILTMSSVGGLTKMMIMCSFSSTKT